jgi:flagellar biosynthesis protein
MPQRPPTDPPKGRPGQDPRQTKRAKAVALDYTPAQNDTPVIVASGQGTVAERILAEAFKSGVAVREDAALADILSAYDIGSPIPLEAFQAVAEILHYLYLADRSKLPPQPDFRPNPYVTARPSPGTGTGRGS